MAKGNLYIVAGPIGNLGDITFRALEVLKSVDLILSEDTRETNKLLNRYQISTDQISYRDQNHARVFPKVVELLDRGSNIALVSDSGTPLVSDPGFKLISKLKSLGYSVISIPGPTAVISALVSSGLPTDKFAFLGFLPKSSNKRKALLTKYLELDSTLIIFESPYRIARLLENIEPYVKDRFICVSSELTKIYEQVITGTFAHVKNELLLKKPKGEYILLIAKKGFSLNE